MYLSCVRRGSKLKPVIRGVNYKKSSKVYIRVNKKPGGKGVNFEYKTSVRILLLNGGLQLTNFRGVCVPSKTHSFSNDLYDINNNKKEKSTSSIVRMKNLDERPINNTVKY